MGLEVSRVPLSVVLEVGSLIWMMSNAEVYGRERKEDQRTKIARRTRVKRERTSLSQNPFLTKKFVE